MFNVYAFMPVVPIHVLSDFQLSLGVKLGVRISKMALNNMLKVQQLCVNANREFVDATSFSSLVNENATLLRTYTREQLADLQHEHAEMANDIESLYSASLQRA